MFEYAALNTKCSYNQEYLPIGDKYVIDNYLRVLLWEMIVSRQNQGCGLWTLLCFKKQIVQNCLPLSLKY